MTVSRSTSSYDLNLAYVSSTENELQVNKPPSPKIESLWFFQQNLNIEHMKANMSRYNLPCVFALTKEEHHDDYSLYVYRQISEREFTIDEYGLSVNPNGTIDLITADEPTTYPSLESAIKEGANAFIPYYFLSSLEKENLYFPELSKGAMQQKIAELNELSVQHNLGALSCEQRGFPLNTIALRTASTNQLGIYYLYPENTFSYYGSNGSSKINVNIFYCEKKDFDSDFRLKTKPYNYGRAFDKEFPCSLKLLNSQFFGTEQGKQCEQILPLLQFEQKIRQLGAELDEQKAEQALHLIEVESINAEKIEEFTQKLSVSPLGFFVILHEKNANTCLLLWNKKSNKGAIAAQQLILQMPNKWTDLFKNVYMQGATMPLLKVQQLFEDGFVFASSEGRLTTEKDIKERLAQLPAPAFPLYVLLPKVDGSLTLMFLNLSHTSTISCAYICRNYHFSITTAPQQANLDGKIPFLRYENMCKEILSDEMHALSDEDRIIKMDLLFNRFETDLHTKPFSDPFAYILGFQTQHPLPQQMEKKYTSLLASQSNTSKQILQKYYILWKLNCKSFAEVEDCVEQVNDLFNKSFPYGLPILGNKMIVSINGNSIVDQLNVQLSAIFKIRGPWQSHIDDIQAALQTYASSRNPGSVSATEAKKAVERLDVLKKFIQP